MGKNMKIWLIIAASLVILGSIVFGGVMSMQKWDFKKLSTTKYETNRYDIQEDYKDIRITADTSDITFTPSENSKTAIICYEQTDMKHSVSVKDGVLTISVNDTRKWYSYLSIHFSTPKITVCLPSDQYGSLFVKEDTGDITLPKDFSFENVDISTSTGNVTSSACARDNIIIETSTGSIRAENVTAKTLTLSASTGKITVSNADVEGEVATKVSTGKVKLTDVACKNLTATGNTGGILLDNVVAAEKFTIERTTGDVAFNACDAAEITVRTDTGDVSGTLLTEKVFITQSDTGSVKVPNTVTGGKCQITTDTGDIIITVN